VGGEARELGLRDTNIEREREESKRAAHLVFGAKPYGAVQGKAKADARAVRVHAPRCGTHRGERERGDFTVFMSIAPL
jgi:hypothetical protein